MFWPQRYQWLREVSALQQKGCYAAFIFFLRQQALIRWSQPFEVCGADGFPNGFRAWNFSTFLSHFFMLFILRKAIINWLEHSIGNKEIQTWQSIIGSCHGQNAAESTSRYKIESHYPPLPKKIRTPLTIPVPALTQRPQNLGGYIKLHQRYTSTKWIQMVQVE